MKKLLGIVVLGLLLSGNINAEEEIKIPKFIDNSINAHIEEGFRIINVSATDKTAIYTLQKKQVVKVCYLIILTDKVYKCVQP